jgi:uncharacterized membrane protein
MTISRLHVPPKLLLAQVYAIIIYALLTWVNYLISTDIREFAYSSLVVLAGVATGSVLGFLASPYDRTEKSSFSEYGKAVGTFVSGFLLSKLDKFLAVLSDPATLGEHPSYGARALAFVIAASTAFIGTYAFRMYAGDGLGDSSSVLEAASRERP